MAAGKKTCSTCGNSFIGRSSASYCSGACKQRAHRARAPRNRNASIAETVTQTVTVSTDRGAHRAHSAEAQVVLRALDDELALAGQRRGQPLLWTAQERALLDLIADSIDRTADLSAMYDCCGDDVKLRVKLSAELRLLQQSTVRLLRDIKTDVPLAAPSLRSVKASRAARRRWDRDGDASG
jgi:hypothetical protein